MSREFFAGRAAGVRRGSMSERVKRVTSVSAVLAVAVSGATLIAASPATAAWSPAAQATAARATAAPLSPTTLLSDLGATATVANSLADLKATAQWVGAAATNTSAVALVSLQHNDQAQLLSQLAQVSNPASSEYKQYLTPEQFDARYAPSDASLTAVEAYLKTFGLSIVSVPTNRAYVYVAGNVGEMDRAFATKIDSYMIGGNLFQAPRVQLSIPAALKNVITGITGLDTGDIATPDTATDTSSCVTTAPALGTLTTAANLLDTPPSAAYVNAAPFSTSFSSCSASQAPSYGGQALGDAVQGYTPKQLEGAYGISTAIADGLNGVGETVAVVDAYSSPTMTADADKWSANMGLPKPNLTINDTAAERMTPDGPTIPTDVPILGGTALLSPSGWFGEESLDVEAVHAIAPGASIIVQSAPGDENQLLEMAQNAVVENDVAQEVSNSYGGSGADGDSTNSTSDGYWEQAGMEGIGVEFASGDDGDNTGGGATDASAGVDDGPNSPYVTAVGGTTLAIGPTDKYEWETYWSDETATLTNGAWGSLSYDGGGGGGTSEVYAEPTWQKGVVPASIANYWHGNSAAESSSDTIPGRAVPDVAMLADPNTGFYMGLTEDFNAESNPLQTPLPTDKQAYGQFRIGGTSLASPLFAGMMALADQAAGTKLGFADPALYALHTATPKAFHDPDLTSPVTGVVRTNYNDTTGLAGSGPSNETTVLRTFDDLKGIVQALPGYDDSTGLGSPNGLTFLCGLAPESTILKKVAGAPCGTKTVAQTTTGTQVKTCTRATHLRYAQHTTAPVKEIKAVEYINGRKVKTVRSKRITQLTVARPRATRFRVRIVATLSDGEVRSDTYAYHGCKVTRSSKVLHKRTHKV